MERTNDYLQQAAAVPYRFRDGQPRFCLITNRKGRWGFPKGIIDPGETAEETALKESEEEAGILGRIDGSAIGQYTYRKWGRRLLVTVFLMEVTAAEDQWQESWRQREWFTAKAAREIIDRSELLPLIDTAEKILAADESG